MVELLKLTDDVIKKRINVSNFLDALILDALRKKASDIHIEAKEGNTLLIRYRIDGVLRDIIPIGQEIKDSLLFIIKVRSKLRTDVHFAPQDGKILFTVKKEAIDPIPEVTKEEEKKKEEPKEEKKEEKKDKKKKKETEEEVEPPVKNLLEKLPAQQAIEKDYYHVDARISILPVTHGEKVVIRLLSQANRAYGLTDLGFEEEDLIKLEKAYKQPYGLFLVTGPTGSGKTTTLYSILKILNTRDVNITTIEDPVEYSIEGVNHIQINPKGDLTFANGLRSILRQDPNIIMVGEIRDKETARITVNSALTGHLVLSTVHANDAVSTIPRLIDMGIEPFLVASTLNIVIAQRLARRLCPNCKKEYTPSRDVAHKEALKLRPDIQKHMANVTKVYRASGCKECNYTGYSGRIGIYEILPMTKALRDVIISSPNSDDILAAAKKGGFRLMVEDAVKKLKDGYIDIKELTKVIAIKE
ncbi:MAG TPA: GspE/PulE family protein [Candidatus Dojkabacteria bacterium]|nr:GspE/PulE family protein [Candidatus Dojkabacteria bacterium]HNW23237.1 GspE/PulE family protein [Candidatus Dojkabacteria bacterium]